MYEEVTRRIYVILGSCALILNKQSCLAEPSPVSSDSSNCFWDSSSLTCHYFERSRSLMDVVSIALFSSLLSIPLIVGIECICFKVLAADLLADIQKTTVDEVVLATDAELGLSEPQLTARKRQVERLEYEYNKLHGDMSFARCQMTELSSPFCLFIFICVLRCVEIQF